MRLPTLDPATLFLRALPYLVAVALVGVLGFMAYRWAYNRGADDVRRDWQAAVAEAGLRFGEALAAQQARLEQTQSDLDVARRKAAERRKEVRDAYVADPVAREWGDVPVPDSLHPAFNRYRNVPGNPAVADGTVPDAR